MALCTEPGEEYHGKQRSGVPASWSPGLSWGKLWVSAATQRAMVLHLLVLLLPRKTLPGRIHPRGQKRPIHSASPAVRPQQRRPVLSPAPRGRCSCLCLPQLAFKLILFFIFCQTILTVMLPSLRSHVPSCDTSAPCFFHCGHAQSPRACGGHEQTPWRSLLDDFLIAIIFSFDSNVSVLKPKT